MGHMQISTSPQTDNTLAPHSIFYRPDAPFMPPNQQGQSTEESSTEGSTYLLCNFLQLYGTDSTQATLLKRTLASSP